MFEVDHPTGKWSTSSGGSAKRYMERRNNPAAEGGILTAFPLVDKLQNLPLE